MPTTDSQSWITIAEARRILGGVSYPVVRALIESGDVGVRRVPGARPRVSRADVEAVLARSTRPATSGAGGGDQGVPIG